MTWRYWLKLSHPQIALLERRNQALSLFCRPQNPTPFIPPRRVGFHAAGISRRAVTGKGVIRRTLTFDWERIRLTHAF